MKKEKILVICAHPDDETLGLGGTLALHSKNGATIFVLIFATGQRGRSEKDKAIQKRMEQGKKACSILGVSKVNFFNYADQKLDAIPIVDLTKKIECAIEKFNPHVVYTHFWGDTNQDHRKLYEATLIAVRPLPDSNIKRVICFETPSSTEWAYGQKVFTPNLFVKIDNFLNKKLKATKVYTKELRRYPHPRSLKSIENRAKHWGSICGVRHAEAFYIVRDIIK